MKIRSKEFKRFLPGIFTSLTVIATTALLLFLSVDPNTQPIARIKSSSEVVKVGQPIQFDGRNSTDPDGDELSYHWTINETMYNMEPFFHYSFPTPGNFTVVLKVEDGSGLSDIETIIIDVR